MNIIFGPSDKNEPGYLTKTQQGEGKIAAKTYNRCVEQAFLPSTQLRGKFRSV